MEEGTDLSVYSGVDRLGHLGEQSVTGEECEPPMGPAEVALNLSSTTLVPDLWLSCTPPPAIFPVSFGNSGRANVFLLAHGQWDAED